MPAKVSPQILLRLRPRIVWADEGLGCGGLLSPSLFHGFAVKPRASLGMEGDLVVVAFCPFAAKRAARTSWLFLLMDEKPLVFAGVHTRPISA